LNHPKWGLKLVTMIKINYTKLNKKVLESYLLQFTDAYNGISNIINKVDPMGISQTEWDEYVTEVLPIMFFLPLCDNPKSTQILVIDVFNYYFGCISKTELKSIITLDIAKQIHSYKNQIKI
jgi:hypothetical protein